MSKKKDNSFKYFFILLIYFLIFNSSKQENTLYNIPIEISGQNYLPIIQIYNTEVSSIPKLMVLDINIDKSWIFQSESSGQNEKKYEIISHDFYTLLGNKNTKTIYLNGEIKIDDFNYYSINQVKGDNHFLGAISLNKKNNEYNIANQLKFEDNNILNNKYFGFCLDFTKIKSNEAKLLIGNMYNLNNEISKLIRLPLYQETEEEEKKGEIPNSKWSIKLNGLFIGSINSSLIEKTILENQNNEKKTIININRKYNKGLIIDEPANIETIYNSIYVTKEVMLFLIANYFKGKEKICVRQENVEKNNYEIKYNCFKSKKNKLKNINLILENNITLVLTKDDLLNCAINQNLNSENGEKSEMCEFNIKYHQKIDHYVLGLSAFRKLKTYFLFNDNSILFENGEFLNCFLKKEKFSNISRHKKKSLGQTIKELLSTTLCISLIFALLAGSCYLYEKFHGKIDLRKEEEAEKILHRDKYVNL